MHAIGTRAKRVACAWAGDGDSDTLPMHVCMYGQYVVSAPTNLAAAWEEVEFIHAYAYAAASASSVLWLYMYYV